MGIQIVAKSLNNFTYSSITSTVESMYQLLYFLQALLSWKTGSRMSTSRAYAVKKLRRSWLIFLCRLTWLTETTSVRYSTNRFTECLVFSQVTDLNITNLFKSRWHTRHVRSRFEKVTTYRPDGQGSVLNGDFSIFFSTFSMSAVGNLLQNKTRIISQGDKTVGPRSSLFNPDLYEANNSHNYLHIIAHLTITVFSYRVFFWLWCLCDRSSFI